jgi:hypothetical protein
MMVIKYTNLYDPWAYGSVSVLHTKFVYYNVSNATTFTFHPEK